MTTPKAAAQTPPTTSQPPESISVAAITDLGAGLTRLVVALIPLSARAVSAIDTNLSQMLARVPASSDGTASAQNSSDLGAVTSSLVSATASLSLGLLKAAASGLDAVTRAVSTAASESNPPRK